MLAVVSVFGDCNFVSCDLLFDRWLFNSVACSMHLIFMCLLIIVYMF